MWFRVSGGLKPWLPLCMLGPLLSVHGGGDPPEFQFCCCVFRLAQSIEGCAESGGTRDVCVLSLGGEVREVQGAPIPVAQPTTSGLCGVNCGSRLFNLVMMVRRAGQDERRCSGRSLVVAVLFAVVLFGLGAQQR